MSNNVVVMTFDEDSKAYQALSNLKQAVSEGRIKASNAVVVERNRIGEFKVKDGASDGSMIAGPVAGTLIGSLIGILGGPMGMLFGGLTGAMWGEVASLDTLADRTSVIEQMAKVVPVGATAVIASVEESTPETINSLASHLDGVVLRRPLDVVEAEIEAINEAQVAAVKEARRVLREEHKAEWQDKFDNWRDDVSDRFDHLVERIKSRIKS